MIRNLRNQQLKPECPRSNSATSWTWSQQLNRDARPDPSAGTSSWNSTRDRRPTRLAFRMQTDGERGVIDIRRRRTEGDSRGAYGLNRKETAEFGHRCLLARRLVERGVRFVQVYCGAGSQWDAHSRHRWEPHQDVPAGMDQPSAALIRDLKRARPARPAPLVIWGGEFGRTPMSEGASGRDHNPFGFTTVMAGGGVKGGTVYGKTDEFGLRGVEGKMHVHDLHATILHLMGQNHEKLTYRYLGRDERLTITDGLVAQDILR